MYVTLSYLLTYILLTSTSSHVNLRLTSYSLRLTAYGLRLACSGSDTWPLPRHGYMPALSCPADRPRQQIVKVRLQHIELRLAMRCLPAKLRNGPLQLFSCGTLPARCEPLSGDRRGEHLWIDRVESSRVESSREGDRVAQRKGHERSEHGC